jgi:hypothetical protein
VKSARTSRLRTTQLPRTHGLRKGRRSLASSNGRLRCWPMTLFLTATPESGGWSFASELRADEQPGSRHLGDMFTCA